MADLTSLIKNDLAPALNSHNLDRALQCFDDNAVINFNVPPPGFSTTVKGKGEIRRYFEAFIQGAHVEPANFTLNGDRVEWSGRISNDMFRDAGLTEVEMKNSATIRNNKIVSLNPVLPPDVVQKLQQMGGQKSRS